MMLVFRLLQSLWQKSKALVPKIDMRAMHTYVLFALTGILFSALLILRYSDRKDFTQGQSQVQHQVQTVEKRVDSLSVVRQLQDLYTSQQIRRIEKQNGQLQSVIAGHDATISQIRTELVRMQREQDKALKRIDKMTDQELLEFYRTLKPVGNK